MTMVGAVERPGARIPLGGPRGAFRRPAKRWWPLGLALVALLALSRAVGPSGHSNHQAAGPAQTTYWGAEIGSQLTGTAAPWDMQAYNAFTVKVGRAPSIVAFNIPFVSCDSGPCTDFNFPTPQMTALRDAGAIPFLNWSSQSSPLSTSQPAFRLAKVAAGAYDAYVRRFALEVKAWGQPFFLRFDWEMNRPWFPWGLGANGNGSSPATYVQAWRHVHDIFTSVGAKATWVWCPYIDPAGASGSLAGLYPGNRYVDWTCLDGYNFGTAEGVSSHWQSFASLFAPSYHAITGSIAPGKPMIIGEVASAEGGGSKPAWIRDMLQQIPTRFPKIRAWLWFDATNVQAGGRDATLPLESSPASLASFSNFVASSAYTSNAFGDLARSPVPPPPANPPAMGRLSPTPPFSG